MKQCIKRPVMTEKSLRLAGMGYYTFVVGLDCNKAQIAQNIEQMYNVTVVDVRTVSMHGKVRRVGKRQKSIKQSDWKKAIVRLKQGQTIDVFEVAPEGSA